MQYNQFLPSSGKVGALQILINNVEGDYSQLSEELAELAEKQLPTEEWDEMTNEQIREEYSYAKGGEIADIQKMKKTLISKAKSKGLYENFGQKEVRLLEDKYGYTDNVRDFDNWSMNFDLSKMADGGMFDDNEGFMRADNERSFRYPETEVEVDVIDEPIDLTDNVSSRSNEVVIRPLDEDIDLNEDGRVRAKMGFNPINRNPNKMMAVNQRMIISDLPKPTSNKHKND
jgi:hypothetical protein